MMWCVLTSFVGSDEFYAIPYGDKTAENGSWQPGPGIRLFEALKEALGDLPIIAEDLGFLTDSVRELLAKTGYPGMKVLQFAFDDREAAITCRTNMIKIVWYIREPMTIQPPSAGAKNCRRPPRSSC